MKITVLIPTYNRAEILAKTLEGLEQQTFQASDFDVVVVNDGGQDNTPEVVEQFKTRGLPLISVEQSNTGQGLARNRGLKEARGDIVVLLGDDMIPHPDFLAEHWASHQKNPSENVAILGMIEWHPELEVTAFMAWMVNGSSILGRFGGHQFAFEKLQKGENPDYNFFYTSNLSLKRKFLGDDPFDLAFSKYGWEDIELGYRLEKEKGMRLIFNEKAVTYHHHAMDESGLKRRMEMIGRSAHIIDRKYPELKKVPSLWKKIALYMLSNPLSLEGLAALDKLSSRRTRSLYYYALSKKYFLQGVKSGYTKKRP